MARSHEWPDIVAFYRDALTWQHMNCESKRTVRGIANVAEHIFQTSLRRSLFGWTSMPNLCIQQTNCQPMTGPYLRISGLWSGDVEFRYLDTHIEARQWHRVVPPENTVARFDRFLEQLRWVGSIGKAPIGADRARA